MEDPNEIAHVFGSVLKRLRLEKSLSQEKVGFEADLSRVYIGLLENGRKSPTLATFIRLAKALQISPTVLMSEFEEESLLPPQPRGVKKKQTRVSTKQSTKRG